MLQFVIKQLKSLIELLEIGVLIHQALELVKALTN